MAVVWMFSGQGSQYFNMGRTYYEHEPVFREVLDRLDGIAREELGESVLSYVFRSDDQPFDRLRYSHPAIVMIEFALAQLLLSKEIYPDYLLGASLGELTAATIAGVLSIDTCLRFVCRQTIMFEHKARNHGGMIAVLAEPDIFTSDPELNRHGELAGVNFAQHFVISAEMSACLDIEARLTRRGVVFQRLPVPQAFHSKHMELFQEPLVSLGKKLTWGKAVYPVYSCYQASQLTQWQAEHFWNVVRHPIQFAATLACLEKTGPHHYVDLGPSGTLSNFVKYGINKHSSSTTVHLISPFGDDQQRLQRYLSQIRVSPLRQSIQQKKGIITGMQPIVFMFPGQGAQFKGMGEALFDKYPQLVRQADEILGYSIRTLCLDDPDHLLSKTAYTQPALYVVNCLSFLERKQQEGGEVADFYIGHSLGEYSALFAAGAFDFATGLQLVKTRGQLMSKVSGGGMAAIINLSEEKLRRVLQEPIFSDIDVANINAPGQIVVSGPLKTLETLGPRVEKEYGGLIPLNVSAPFHSRYMEDAGNAFSTAIQKTVFRPLTTPVIANVTAQPYPENPDELKDILAKQMTHSVHWIDSVTYLYQQGCEQFIEIGPGQVLTRLVDKIKLSLVRSSSKAGTTVTSTQVEGTAPTVEKNATELAAHHLGAAAFRERYRSKYAYASGAMYKGIASAELVIRMAQKGYLAFFGSGGIRLPDLEQHLCQIKASLSADRLFGMNLLCDLTNPQKEIDTVQLYLRHQVRVIEAAAFMQVTPALVLFRASGLEPDGSVRHRIIAKISRPEVARVFLSPPAEEIVTSLLNQGLITPDQARRVRSLPVATELCVEADSGGHTDMGSMSSLLPSIIRLRDRMMKETSYPETVLVGAAGGIGSPESAASAFMLGADFIVTGSINQCSVEAGTSDVVKDMLQVMDVQDTDYAPAGDMFELGARVQVLKRGVFFAARANKLYEIWRNTSSIDAIPPQLREQIEKNYFKRSFAQIYRETKAHYLEVSPELIEKAEKNEKFKMALIFRWYFIHSTRMAIQGEASERVNFQIHCGPALGAFNQWVKGTALENWRQRHVDHIADALMDATASFLCEKLAGFATVAEGC